MRRSGLAAAVQRDPPQLVRAVDRRREQDGPAIRRRDEPRPLAQRHVAVHRRVRLELAPGQQVRPAARRRVRAVGREPPDPGPVADPRPLVAERQDRRPVARPRRVEEDRIAAVRDERDLARRDLHDPDRPPLLEVRVPAPVRGERDPGAVRRPGGMLLGRRTRDERPCRAGLDVDEPQVLVLVVDEAGAVVLVVQPVDEPVVGQRRLAGLRLRGPAALPAVLLDRRAQRGGQDRERPAVRRPGELAHALRQVREAPRLTTVERQQEHLEAVVALLGVRRPVGLLLGVQPSIADERERRAVRGDPRRAVRADAERQLAGGLAAIDRCGPDRLAVPVPAHRGALHREHDAAAVGRQAGIERDGEAVQVVGACGSGHGLLRGGSASGGLAGNTGPGGGARIGDAAGRPVYPRRSPRDGRATIDPRWPPSSSPSGSIRRSRHRVPSRRCGRSRARTRSTRPTTCSSPPGAATGSSRSSARPSCPAPATSASWTRPGLDLAPRLPELSGLAVRVAARSAVLDGELVVVDGAGRADDEALRSRLNGGAGRPVALLVFDILHLDGVWLLRTPLEKRRATLRKALRPGDEVVVVPAIAGEGRALHDAVSAQGIAGVLARRRTSPYLPGVRSKLWRSIVAASRARRRPHRRPRRPRTAPTAAGRPRCSPCSGASRSTRIPGPRAERPAPTRGACGRTGRSSAAGRRAARRPGRPGSRGSSSAAP